MLTGDIFQSQPPTILDTSTLGNAALEFMKCGVSDLMVVDVLGNFIGVLSEGDLIRKCMPKYAEYVADGLGPDEIFRLYSDKGKLIENETITSIIINNPITVSRSTPLHKAASYMISKNIRRIPVVEDGKLIGALSRAMIAKALLKKQE